MIASIKLNVVIAGAAPDTGNLGVAALSQAIVHGLSTQSLTPTITVLDNGKGVRKSPRPAQANVTLLGARRSRKVWLPECWARIRFESCLPISLGQSAKYLEKTDAILDISGGDSFTDLYGQRRFEAIVSPKKYAIRRGIPLILLPQTYGPFRRRQNKMEAAWIVRNSALAIARDAHSLEVLRDLLGAEFDPKRHWLGVDAAFLLPGIRPEDRVLPETITSWFEYDEEMIGLNVSGLIYNNPLASRARFGFNADYRKVVLEFVERIMRKSRAHIVLVPHVLTPTGNYESDPDANNAVLSELPPEYRDRILALPPHLDECETKWVISHCDWFCGTRMHSTIAALSSGVPTAAIAYSDKTLGVFETCGQGSHVADPRVLSTEEMIEHLWASWNTRKQAKADLAAHLPGVLRQAEEQMDAIVDRIKLCHDHSAA